MSIWIPPGSNAGQLVTDVTTHHIEGFAHQGNTPFSMPLVTHIDGNLWTGGCIDGARLPGEIEYVVSLYPWERYAIEPARVRRLEFALYDAGELPAVREIELVASIAHEFLGEGPTLIHCQAGLNRSGLIAGLALIFGGMEPAAAVALLREKRSPAVLCNRTFETFLLDQEREAA